MSEKETPTQKPNSTEQDDFMSRAARASQTSIFDTIRDTVSEHRVAAGIAVGAAAFGGAGIAQHAHVETQHAMAVAAAEQQQQNQEDFIKTVDTLANTSPDPASVVGLFETQPGVTVYGEASAIAAKQPNYDKNQTAIDDAILESSKAQGSYENGESFAVVETEINDKPNYVVTKVEDPNSVLTAPEQGDPTKE